MIDLEQKEAIAQDVMVLTPIAAILKKYGISRSTFYRLRQDPEFKEILSNKRLLAWETTVDNCYAMAETAIACITDVLKDEKASPKIRMDAANRILHLTKEHLDEVEILSRIDELKALVEKVEQ